MRHGTRRFTRQYSKVGQALNTSNSEISKDILHENIRGILLAETSGLTPSEFASVPMSGTTGAEGESIIFTSCRSLQYTVVSCCAGSERCQARKSEAVVAAVDNFDLSGLSEAASRIENAISWHDTDPQIW